MPRLEALGRHLVEQGERDIRPLDPSDDAGPGDPRAERRRDQHQGVVQRAQRREVEGAVAGAVGMDGARALLPGSVTYCADAYDAAQGADVLVVVTEWNEFRALSPDRLCRAMRGRLVMDLRNVFDPAAVAAAGLDYHGVGRAAKPER